METVASSSERLVVERDGHIGWITFNQPHKHNALSGDMLRALSETLAAWEDDADLRVVVLAGAGPKSFVSGADIGELGGGIDGSSRAGRGRGMVATSKPVIAMIHGYCIGAGLAVALEADLRVASRDAVFAIPAVRLGVAYPLEAIEDLVGIVGSAVASRLLLTGVRIDAEEAQRVGLIHELVEPGDLRLHVADLAGRLAANAPLTMRAAKLGIRSAVRGDEGIRVRAEQAARDCWTSEDFAEGRAAFAASRQPQWRGR